MMFMAAVESLICALGGREAGGANTPAAAFDVCDRSTRGPLLYLAAMAMR
jgi:hypothetical protein